MRRRIIDPLEYYKEHFPGLTPSEVKQRNPTLYYRLVKTGLTKELPRKDGKLPIEIRMKLNEFFLEDGYRDPTFYLPEIRFRTGKDGKKHVCTFHIDGHRHSLKPSFGLPYTDVELKQLFFGEFGWVVGAYINNELIRAWKINPNRDGRQLLPISSIRKITLEDINNNNSLEQGMVKGNRKRKSFGDNPYEFYRTHYPDLSRGRLAVEDPSLYATLKRAGLLHLIPKIRGQKKREPNSLEEFLTSGFTNRDFQLELSARTDKKGIVDLRYSDGKRHKVRIYTNEPETDVLIRTASFHNQYGRLLAIYRNNDGVRDRLLEIYRVNRTGRKRLQPLIPSEVFLTEQEVRDETYGRGIITDVYNHVFNNKPYVKVEFESKNSGIVHYPFERALEMFSIV